MVQMGNVGETTRFGSQATGQGPGRSPSPGHRPRCYIQVGDRFDHYREAVTQGSPGLPRSGYPGREFRWISEPCEGSVAISCQPFVRNAFSQHDGSPTMRLQNPFRVSMSIYFVTGYSTASRLQRKRCVEQPGHRPGLGEPGPVGAHGIAVRCALSLLWLPLLLIASWAHAGEQRVFQEGHFGAAELKYIDDVPVLIGGRHAGRDRPAKGRPHGRM